ncbi:A/G-specific adenine glycosylase [Caldisericum sp.]|uniref:A/G-specific adenine glycosylase n=1 Tax=Caldisericum sp. TaxID=2499687 RepID=UPI003D14CAED
MTYSETETDGYVFKWLYARVIEWAKENLRSFPWRNTSDPYKIFLAETLLKRTTATAAVRIYNDLINKYPDISTLASASVKDLNYLLRPLGLYKQRSELLIKSARYIVEKMGGKFPYNIDDLVKVPGIGLYTASAISSFAFRKPVPTVDSNVIRVLRRFLDKPSLNVKIAMNLLSSVIEEKNGSEFNLGIIDLGGTICKPTNPNCNFCPIREKCSFYLNNINKNVI